MKHCVPKRWQVFHKQHNALKTHLFNYAYAPRHWPWPIGTSDSYDIWRRLNKWILYCIVTFRVSRRRREMYIGHARLGVYVLWHGGLFNHDFIFFKITAVHSGKKIGQHLKKFPRQNHKNTSVTRTGRRPDCFWRLPVHNYTVSGGNVRNYRPDAINHGK